MSAPTIDQSALTELLDGRWAELRRSIRAELAGSGYTDPIGLTTDEHRDRVLQQLTELAATGQPLIGFPTEYGGKSDTGGSIAAFEALAYGDLSLMVKAGVQWGLWGGAVQLLGTERHHKAYLPSIMNLDLPGCFAMTETGHGSDVQNLRTTATYDPATGEFVIHTPHESARKDYIGNAARHGRKAAVFAQLITDGESRGVHAFVVPIRDDDGNPLPGVTISDCGIKAGLNGVDNGRLSFDEVRVPREALLNRYADVAEDGTYSSSIESDGRRFFTMLGTLVRGRVSVAGAAGSATKRALTIAVRYGDTRRQFAAPGGPDEIVLLDYQAHQRKLLPAIAKTYALSFAQDELVSRLDELQGRDDVPDEDQRELESRAAGIKAIGTWHATHTIQTCREACGGAGYLAENLLPMLKADTDVFTTFEGDNTVLLQLVAKGLLTQYKDDFEDLTPMGTARFVAEQVADVVVERTSARKVIERILDANRDEEEIMLSRAWQIKAFEDREKHVLDGLVKRLRRATDDDAFAVFNSAQDHLLRAGRVHVERVLLEAFLGAIDRCEDAELAMLLDSVCDLYVMSTVERDLAWFLGHNRLSAARGKTVTSAVDQLCAQLRPHARTLVDAFAIPDAFLQAAILQEEPSRQETQREHDRSIAT